MKRILSAAAVLLASGAALAQSTYQPPTRPWSVYFDGETSLRFPYSSHLNNAPLTSHRFIFHIEMAVSRYQKHAGYTQLFHTSWPNNDQPDIHAISVQMGGVDVWRNYVWDDNGERVWDGTWAEACGPTQTGGGPNPCRGYLYIIFQSGIGGTAQTFELFSPYVFIFDDDDNNHKMHVYDVIIDTDATGDDNNPQYTAQWSVDGIVATAVYDTTTPDDGNSIFALTDNNTFIERLSFPVDTMDNEIAGDFTWEHGNYPEYVDAVNPTMTVNRFIVQMNSSFTPDIDSWAATNHSWVYEDAGQNLRPANVMTPGYPLGAPPEVYNYGNPYQFQQGISNDAWILIMRNSSEDFDKGTTGSWQPGAFDMYP